MYLNTDWPRYLLDGGFCNYGTNSQNWHFVYIMSMVPLQSKTNFYLFDKAYIP